jgi:hypothetical protein
MIHWNVFQVHNLRIPLTKITIRNPYCVISHVSNKEIIGIAMDYIETVRIILTTTFPLSQISNAMNSTGINQEDVLLKPFKFSRLLSVIQPK